MSLLERIRTALRGTNGVVEKTANDSSKWIETSMTVVRNGDGAKSAPFSHRAAVQAYRSWIFAAANLNAIAVASQPLRLYVRTSPTGQKLFRTAKVSRRVKAYHAGACRGIPSRSVLHKVAEFGSDYEVVTESHPVTDLLTKVNPYMNGFDATVLRVLWQELTGNAYWHPVIDRALGIPTELWPMPPQFVEIVPGKDEFIEGFIYGATREQRKFFPSEEVIHFRRPNPGDLYYGIGKLEAAWGAAMMNTAVHEMDLSFFENKARPDYLLTVKGVSSEEELERFEAQIQDKLRGTRRTGHFLTSSAEIDVKPLAFPPKDLGGREDIVEEIAAVFGVPVSMLKANDPNLASATTGFAQWRETTILPLCRMDEETLNERLLPLFGLGNDAFLAYDDPVPENEQFALQERQISLASGWRTVNEIREELGLERIEDPHADMLHFNGQPLGGAPQPALPPFGASAPVAQVTSQDQLVGPLDDAGDEADEVSEKAVETKDALGDCVSAKIPKLLDEGYPQDQAIAIAYSMCSEGKSVDEAVSALGIKSAKKAVGDIDTRPPSSVAANARRALAVREEKPESERGMTAVGIARARDLANRAELSEETIRRMVAYFERHESDKQGETWDEQGKGWQAWNGWGGDEGWSWAKRKVEEFDRARGGKRAKSCGCGCDGEEVDLEMTAELFAKILDELDFEDDMISKNCGIGPEGFEQGNECGGGAGGGGSGGDGGGDKPKESKPRKPSKPRGSSKPAKGKPPAEGMAAPKEHNADIPPNPKKITIDQAENAFRSMGYEMAAWKPSAEGTTVTLRDSGGKETKLPVSEAVNLIYANSRDPKMNDAPALKPKKSVSRPVVSQKALWEHGTEPLGQLRTKAGEKEAERELRKINEAERKIRDAVGGVLDAQSAAVIAEIRKAGAVTPNVVRRIEVYLRSNRWNAALVDALAPYLKDALFTGVEVGLDAVAKASTAAPEFDPARPELERYVETESVRLAQRAADGINRYTSVRVGEILGDGIAKGETVDQLAGRVKDWAAGEGDDERATERRAVMIARTESQRAARSAETEAWKATGIVQGKTWLLAPDPCEFCEAAAKAFGDKSIGLEDSFYRKGETIVGADGGEMALDYEAIDGPPLHPNCRCSMQPILSPELEEISRDIEAGIEAEIQSEVLKMETEG